MIEVEIIAIGSELLLGDVLDTNSHWLCKQIAGLGGRMRRIAVVGDEDKAIAEEVEASLERKPNLIITTGGLGPTTDDITLQAMAQGMGLPVELNPRALEMVKGRYEELVNKGYIKDGTLTEARRKMAYLPRGATPIFNPVGTAPACLLRRGESLLLSLPGVPEEMKGIWEESLTPFLRDLFGEGFYQEIALLVDCGDESVLAPILQGVARAHPKVYLKSRATKFGPEVKIKVTLSCAGEGKARVREAMDKALEELRGAFQASGLAMEEI